MNTERIEKIRTRLEQAFQPVSLEIDDQSHLHAGHAGARDGKGHFQINIVSAAFNGKPLIKRHRLVYEALGEMLETDIHALIINALPPE
ncbi:MAG: BolA family transcriptional regulator [Gammaproteobacteria bacterium]|nr:BolA family transcriptional regulator [Gammaproteobacteria bacterium]MCP4090850.1 BolA family transcriptional regulator [Gammaproteobacteria bacterium]MCP4275542.1 BolA family transcriptional regulator [Gammaproteobacteria bacterium]MCP4832264.1 BolA family transcriptional regulator [Gammaproteobacteria bacterium]MCP4930318.1 BolA family transcriptional regulator [Gammaproteobacteria bacterium]